MNISLLLWGFVFTFICTSTGAATVGPELIADPDFDEPGSWDVGVGNTIVDSGHLTVINHTGFFP